MINYNIFNRLVTVLKFKKQQNSCYFIVKNDFKADKFTIYKGAMLTFSRLYVEEEDYLYLNLIYKTRALNSKITIDVNDEGLVKLSYRDLASLLISDKLEAFYSDINEYDNEIYKLISN